MTTINQPTRQMRCTSHHTRGHDHQTEHTLRPSNPAAFLFRARPDQDQDEFYCGCFGWD